MRVSICVERGDKVYRLAWVSESKSGVYLGHLGANEDHHVSYHQDGKRHFKSGDLHHGAFVDLPIASHKGFKQLSNGNVALTKEWLNARTEYPASPRAETLISLAENVFNGFDSLSIDWYLVDSASEVAFREMINRRARTREQFALVDLRSLALHHFPGHNLGLALWAARTRT